MLNFWPFKKASRDTTLTEKRSSMSGYTSMILSARESYLAGRSGLGELTSTVQACVSLWQAGLGTAKVTGTDLLGRHEMGIVGRSLALRGESLWLIRDRLIPASDWSITTRDGIPRSYRVSISEAGGGRTETVLAGEVLHFRINVDSVTPWAGQSPLHRASLTAGLLQAVETALAETFEFAPLGSLVVPWPEAPDTDTEAIGRALRGQRGRILVRESVNVAAAGGPAPASDWRPSSVSPSIEGAMPDKMLAAARDGIALAYGVLPGILDRSLTGPQTREVTRFLATWVLAPIGEAIAEECTNKLDAKVEIDVVTALDAFDQGAASRSVVALVEAAARAKEAGLSDEVMAGIFSRLNWEK